ncbi:MAG: hypothetical protein M3R27_12800 [Bacteroidota bacterium]|nr:hypothetical protein [Bacteroidota bacterium]
MSANNLHLLIKSLTAPEKGYIKKQATIHVIGEQNKYIRIFDAIDKQKEYDEKAILKKFKNDPILNNFSVAKNYLFKFILKSLESYHSNVKSDLRSSLNQVEILYNKNLPVVAKKMLLKAKATAQQYELYEFMEAIIDWEIILLTEEATNANYFDLVNKYFGELNDCMDKKKTIISYKHLYHRMRAKSLYSGIPRNDSDLIEFQKIIDEVKTNDKGLHSTFNAQFYSNLMQSNFLFVLNEQKKASEFLKKNVDLLEQNSHMIKIKPFAYLGVLRNKAVNELALLKYKDLFETLAKMDAFIADYGQVNRYFEVITENLKLFVFIPTGQFEKALQIALNLEQLYLSIPPTKTLQKERQLQHYAFAYIYIGLKKFKEANQHITILLHHSDFDIRSDLFCFAHILSLIVHFEMDNTELLEYRIRSTYRLLLKRDKLYNFEKQILNFFKVSQGQSKNSPELIRSFRELKKNIESETTSKLEKNAFNLFDLVSWLESKIEDKSFMEIKQQKFDQLMAFESSNAHML